MKNAVPKVSLFIVGLLALVLHAPVALAQQTDAGFRGGGAAMCIAAGELLTAQADAPAGVGEDVLRWRQVLHVMDGTPEQRESAVIAARASWADLEARRAGLGVAGARGLWSSACVDDMQVRYIAVHGSEERARFNLAEDPNVPLDRAAAARLNVAASCLAAVDLFSTARPSARLRRALHDSTPSAPDAAMLDAIRQRAQQDIATADGAAAGKALVVEYLRYLYQTAAGGEAPQQFVNSASQTLQTRCPGRPTEPTHG